MNRYTALFACVAGIVVLFLVLPLFDSAQPEGVRLTRAEAQKIADAAARERGIPVDRAWSNLTWSGSPLLDKELASDPERRKAAQRDPVIGPRLGAYQVNYYRYNKDKYPPYGGVNVDGRTGEVTGAVLQMRNEEPGKTMTEAQLRPRADAFLRGHGPFPGAPSLVFESARPTVYRGRTDWVFRYSVPSTFAGGRIIPYLRVYFAGDRLAGWDLNEEYGDGHAFVGEFGDRISGLFLRMSVLFTLLIVLLVMFLLKYHAGEVGVGTATFLFAAMLLLSLVVSAMTGPAMSQGTGLANLDGQKTSFAVIGFKFLFYDIPVSLLVFLSWAVGESYARERWGEKLASFDAILRHDAFNASVGESLMRGLLMAPVVPAAALLIAAIPLRLHLAHPDLGEGTNAILFLGGPWYALLTAAHTALAFPLLAILFVLAFTSRKRLLPVGVGVALVLGAIGFFSDVPVGPAMQQMLFGFGGAAAAVTIFLASDLLTAVMAAFGGSLLLLFLPLARAASGSLQQQMLIVLILPFAAILGFSIAALMTKREIEYTYEDLAPHVKRIVERERVKAEIDAANRIQAALLPLEPPNLAGASVASHYRAATEIGGDYFDFLPQPTGEIGIAFGDVSGHGLTSGIVMAMAKSALLVQVDYDSSPAAVLEMLNEVVRRTAPKRILMTFFFGLLNPRTQQLRFSSAGHLDPYVYRAAGRRIEPLSSWGFPLGVKRRDPFRETTAEFMPGDRLILYSDGLIEAVDVDGDPYGFERFERAVLDAGHLSAEEIKKSLLGSVRKFTRNRPPEDDQTLVVVSFDEPATEPVLVISPLGTNLASEPVN
ncbi:MAG TPA: PP2C family protein-serine/threonine phosphatase [Thermoanaerobaculia bacterium]|nr:PP2C family protein-serine/threonine phosphatase [Thermoanaerobaculia bacterium]